MKFCLDRIEGGVAICYPEPSAPGAAPYEFSLSAVPALRGLADGTLFEAEMSCCACLRDIRVLQEETKLRRSQAEARLQALFDRNKKR